MRVGFLVCLSACTPRPAQPDVHQVTITCTDAVTRAGGSTRITDADTKQLVSNCEQQQWPAETRACVAKARAQPDLQQCLAKVGVEIPSSSARNGDTPSNVSSTSEPDAAQASKRIADRTCACSDAVCAEKAVDDLFEYLKTDLAPSVDLERFQRDVERIANCAVKAGVPPGTLRSKAQAAQAARPKKSGYAEAMAKMNEFRDRMCACKDVVCAKQVSDEMVKWSQEQTKDQPKNELPKLSEKDNKEATQIGEAMGNCMRKAIDNGH